MVDSGIKCHGDCTAVFCELEKKNLDYIIMKIEKNNGVDKVVVRKKAEKGSCVAAVGGPDKDGVPAIWSEFSREMCEDKEGIAYGCAYISYPTKDGRTTDKLIFVFWCLEDARIAPKMTYSSTKLPTSRKIKSVSETIHCADKDEISYKEVLKQVAKGEAAI